MKGRATTKADQAFHNKLAGLGCVACLKDGHLNPWISIHHIDGRTKPGAHRKVLALCAGHHQDGTGQDKTMIAVHPFKARFEERYGSQYELLEQCKALLGVE